MARSVAVLLAALVLIASSPSAHSFTGRWVADLDTQSGLGKDVYLVSGGFYSCESCTPRRHYRADGRLHPIAGDPDVRAESVTIRGPRTIVTRIVARAVTRTTTMTVSRDGRTATYVSVDHRLGIREPLRTVYVARRLGDRPHGTHDVSGTWQGVAYESVPELVRTTKLRDTGRTFSYEVPIGAAYSAPFGGPAVDVKAPGSTAMKASVRRQPDGRIVETRTRDEKQVLKRTFILSADGNKLTIVSFYPQNGSTFRITAHRQR